MVEFCKIVEQLDKSSFINGAFVAIQRATLQIWILLYQFQRQIPLIH